MQNLANWPKSQDVYALTQFIQHDAQNVANGKESYFKMKVYEPPCLSVDVPDKKYAHAVESTMNQTQLRVSPYNVRQEPVEFRLTSDHPLLLQTVICQCQEDYAKLGAFADNANNPIGRQLSQLNIALVEPSTPRQTTPVDREEVCPSCARQLETALTNVRPPLGSFDDSALRDSPLTWFRLRPLS